MRTLPVGLRLLQLAGAVEAKKKRKEKKKAASLTSLEESESIVLQ
jgi:hypothetical protein